MAAAPSRLPRLLALVAVIAGTALFLAPAHGMAPAAQKALGLVVFVVGLWATNAIPVHVTSFLFFFLATVTALAPPSAVFSGFAAGATWLVFGGVVIGMAVHATGLGRRIATGLVLLLPRSYLGTITGISLACVGLAFVLPSAMGRVVILIPIVQSLADRMGFGPDRNGRHGMAMAVGLSSILPAMSLLPATTPNVVLAGAAESLHGVVLHYGAFAFLHGVAGLLAIPVIILLVVVIFPDRAGVRADPEPPGPIGAEERRLALVLVLTLAFWATDVVHGIAPAWVALGAAIVCMLPYVRLVSPEAVVREANYSPWFLLAGIIGLGAVVSHTGLSQVLGRVMLDTVGFAPGADFYNFAAIIVVETVLGVLMTFPSVPAMLTPLAPDIAAAAGWPLETAVMAQVPGFFAILLPYEAPPILTAMLLARVPYGGVARLCLSFTAIYLVAITPVNFLWWRALGMFAE
ncbi:MAG: SLC13 family permease [Alphaproteobacteria bacterium]|nr:SLC13 family permease [Alphaproteobacteria bacterium]